MKLITKKNEKQKKTMNTQFEKTNSGVEGDNLGGQVEYKPRT